MGERLQQNAVSLKDLRRYTDVLALLRDLGQDSRNMAAMLSVMLTNLARDPIPEPNPAANPQAQRTIEQARDLAGSLHEFMSWVDDDPFKLLNELQSVAADNWEPAMSDGHSVPLPSR